jgi:hypothetical protein
VFQIDRSTLRSSITFSAMKSRRREVALQYISTDEKIEDILVNPLSKMKNPAYSREQDGARADKFLIEKGRDDSQVGREH